MARVTVQDCLDTIPNPFELTVLAAHRARQLTNNAPTIPVRPRDRNTVTALREIAAKTLDIDDLRFRIAENLRRVTIDPDLEAELDIVDVTEQNMEFDDQVQDVTAMSVSDAVLFEDEDDDE